VREQYDQPASIERRRGGEVSGTEATPEAERPTDDSMRRFTDSVDVRLDILEEELGGLHDEVNRLEQAVRDGVDAAQRRLVRVYAVGQLLLAVLILVLFLRGWPLGGRALEPEPSPPDLSTTLAPTAEIDSATTPMSPEAALVGEGVTGVGTETAAPSGAHPEKDEPVADAPEQPLRPQGQGTADPLQEGQPAETDPAKASSGSGEPDEQDLPGAASPPASATDGQTSPVPGAESLASAPGDGEQGPPPSAELQPVGPGQAARSLPAEKERDPETSAPADALAPAGGTTSIPEGGRIVVGEERFAIQLISFRSAASLPPFVAKFGIADKARYMLSQAQDQDWYSVLLGVYGTREEGVAAVDALPPPLRALDPWVRSLPAGTELVPVGAASDVASNE
jgi:septal ring-binding cell division protein DamX